MNPYGDIAVRAAKYVQLGSIPRDAWEKASWEVYPQGGTARQKGCPRTAFLGLYDALKQSPNAKHARDAREYLIANRIKSIAPRDLWAIILNGKTKSYNSQMDVVLALYDEKMLPR